MATTATETQTVLASQVVKARLIEQENQVIESDPPWLNQSGKFCRL